MKSARVPDEKRGAPRVPVSLTAHCRIGNRFVREPVADISIGGLYLKSNEPVKEGAEIRVALALPYADGPRFCTLAGCIVRIDRDERGRLCGVGVSFQPDAMASTDLETLETFVSGKTLNAA